MKNADKPVYPQDIGGLKNFAEKGFKSGRSISDMDKVLSQYAGLTKRERFAMAAMQGMLSNAGIKEDCGAGVTSEQGKEAICHTAVRYADRIMGKLKRLEKTEES